MANQAEGISTCDEDLVIKATDAEWKEEASLQKYDASIG